MRAGTVSNVFSELSARARHLIKSKYSAILDWVWLHFKGTFDFVKRDHRRFRGKCNYKKVYCRKKTVVRRSADFCLCKSNSIIPIGVLKWSIHYGALVIAIENSYLWVILRNTRITIVCGTRRCRFSIRRLCKMHMKHVIHIANK